MDLIINELPYFKKCDNALFLFQAFTIDKVEFLGFKEDQIIGKIKVHVRLSKNDVLQTSLQKNKLLKKLSKIYQQFYQELKQLNLTSCYFLIDASYYENWFDLEDSQQKRSVEIKNDLDNKFNYHATVREIPKNLNSLIGKDCPNASSFQSISDLHVLQAKKEDYEFLEKAPMDIGLAFFFSACIMGAQAYLWIQIGVALNTYYYVKQYSSFFWTYGITTILFAAIILLLFIPLFFLLRSGGKDFIR